jgi:hypothetical protein
MINCVLMWGEGVPLLVIGLFTVCLIAMLWICVHFFVSPYFSANTV